MVDQELEIMKHSGDDKKKSSEVIEKHKPVPLSQILGVVSLRERLLFWASSVAAVLSGAVVPMFILLFGEIMNSFGPDSSMNKMMDDVTRLALYTLYIGIGLFFMCYLFVTGMGRVADNVASQLRRQFFQAVMSQNVAWFDANASTEFASRIAKNSSSVQHGLGEKLGRVLYQFGIFIAGITIALYKGLRLAAVVAATVPLILLSGYLFSKSMELMVSGNHQAYQKSGGVAEETLNSVKTVAAFNSQKKKIDHFCSHLEVAKERGITISSKMGAGIGLLMGTFFAIYAVAFYYGGYLIEEEEDNISSGEVYQAGKRQPVKEGERTTSHLLFVFSLLSR
mmetsp:Transcript_63445/g.72686  ORF Transcript_63445/g.72686 Transcript_63445/m.72686 type:complete len:338 (+) Transcript_63445:124-1137(+)